MIYLLLVCSMLSCALSFDVDYYLGIMRTTECDSGNKKECDRFCYGASSICYKGECYCQHKILTSDNAEKNKASQILRSIYAEEVEDTEERPALRHHIAHFCPNLDVARECIRKCIMRGLPAFCGKDHKCYCGHSYDPDHEKTPTAKEKETHTQFKDLYEKYFGKRPSVKDEVVQNDE